MLILQQKIPYSPLEEKKLPGIQPLEESAFLRPDEAFCTQMAYRDALVAQRPDAVIAMDQSANPAAQELLDLVLDQYHLKAGEWVCRADGVKVAIDRAAPMQTLARLVQQDLCLLEKPEGAEEHVLTAAALCFPASWMLAEKFMKPLVAIHVPVDSYDTNIARRVQRLFDGVQAGRPLWRFNALWYHDPDLHQPRSESAARPKPPKDEAQYMRSEKQMILRLPRTRAVVFAIHTYVLRREDVLRQWAIAAPQI